MEGKTDIDPEGSYLRQVLSDCLTEAVVELVLRRPTDPIDFLAHYLYKYRNLHPLTKGELETLHTAAKTVTQQQTAVDVKPRVELKVMTDNEDFRMDDDLSPGSNIGKVVVHSSYVSMFDSIGDIFDDDDDT